MSLGSDPAPAHKWANLDGPFVLTCEILRLYKGIEQVNGLDCHEFAVRHKQIPDDLLWSARSTVEWCVPADPSL